ncbi:protein of unknown function [Methylorubrum extorquens]|uniref:Uncharacterized protein n=1 Tax=Methylorubrum extorquens TaxID=408 RepID=A0A2N9AZ11_METEX|nr:protein of unknown function [Methylorubrum extorquens]
MFSRASLNTILPDKLSHLEAAIKPPKVWLGSRVAPRRVGEYVRVRSPRQHPRHPLGPHRDGRVLHRS